MLFQTPAILLSRELLNAYDEKLTFFTQKMGKTLVYSYGSRSPRSNRGSLLRKPAWLELSIEQTPHAFTLRNARKIRSIVLPSNYSEILLFQELLKWCLHITPFHIQDTSLYSLLEVLTQEKSLNLALVHKAILYPASLLKLLGELPSAEYCHACHIQCSPFYTPTSEETFIGTDCTRMTAHIRKILPTAFTTTQPAYARSSSASANSTFNKPYPNISSKSSYTQPSHSIPHFLLSLQELLLFHQINTYPFPHIEAIFVSIKDAYLSHTSAFEQSATYLKYLLHYKYVQ